MRTNGETGGTWDTFAGDDGSGANADVAQLGARIRYLRVGEGLTLSELAERTRLSVSMLSTVERGRANPTVGTLIAIADALAVSVTDLFGADGAAATPVARWEEQRVIRAGTGFTRRLLVHDRSRGIELVINRYEPGAHSHPRPNRHQGYELGFVLAGRVHYEVDGVRHELRRGDAVAYPSTTPHRSWNAGKDVARTVWVNLYQY